MFDMEKLKKAQQGDREAIEEICTETWKPLYRYIYYKVQNREEAEDITQETFVKALAYMHKNTATIEKFIAFLKAVSLNVLRDKWRKNKRHGMVIDIDQINPEEIASEDPSEAGAQRAVIEEALDRLNEEQRTVIDLRILKGYSAAETAAVMGKKENTVRVIQYRALRNLADILKNNE